MSTYYQFRCPKCLEQGGFFSRQMWGWGNCDIFENFKFQVAHAHCGTLEIVSEHDERYFHADEEMRWFGRLEKDEDLREAVWPHADEWDWVRDDWAGAQEKWIGAFGEKLKSHRNEAERASAGAQD